MKKTLLFLVVLAGLVSCQIIKPEDRYIKVEEPQEESERNVLLMDFTGWQCVNCPDAAKVANGLVERYGSHVIVVSMHPEGMSFTEPGASGPKFATKEAMDYLKAYGGSNTLPVGVVDGLKYGDSYFLEYQEWAAAVTEELKVDVDYSMELTANTSSCEVMLTQNGPSDRKVKVVLWLLEDSIIAPQLGVTGEYAHRHVFRKCLNGSDIWGEDAEFSYGEAYITAEYELPELEGKNFVIVAVAFDADTKEVLQAEEVELKQKGEGTFHVIYEGDTLQDGDSIDVYKVLYESGKIEFEGSIVSTYIDENMFSVTETRHFDATIYTVEMCFNVCKQEDPEHPGYWECKIKGLGEQPFQSHIKIPEEQWGDEVNLVTDYAFSDGVTTKTIKVKLHYAPEEPVE